MIICTKVRDGDKRIVDIKEGEPKGKHVFIVDDLVKTGGTLIECKGALKKKGAAKVSAFVTHCVFPQESWKRFTDAPDEEKFDHFYVTDSCSVPCQEIMGKKPFHIIPLASSIVDCINHYNL